MSDPVRADIWLWAARFFKTRALAAEAVKGGRVQLGGVRIKASKDLRPGDVLEIGRGQEQLTVVVRDTARRRGPAAEAALLYEETAESREARERAAEERRLAHPPGTEPRGGPRPTKRDRRRFESRRTGR